MIRLLSGFLAAVVLFGTVSVASAHSTVAPAQTSTQKYETFTLSVPTEKEVPTVGMRLIVPAELDRVTPFVKPGWRITTKKDASGKITEIAWTGGSIPADQKDVFQFTARTGATSTMLVWKAYQTYSGGEVVAWDRDPKDVREGEERVPTPYSVTEVAPDAPPITDDRNDCTMALILGAIAVLISITALGVAMHKRA